MMKLRSILLLTALVVFSCEYADEDPGALSYSLSQDGFMDLPAGDNYAEFEDNPFVQVSDEPTSTFSVDADGASYSNLRRFILDESQVPPKGAVRIEEMLNYFDLNYPYQPNDHPISIEGEISSCPWKAEHKLIRVGIEGKPLTERPHSNYVFLIDVSGSMSSEDKLELLKNGFIDVLDEMDEEDRIAIVTYAGSAGVILDSTPVSEKEAIKSAIRRLGSGGSTAGAQGILTAYEIAESHFIEGGNNRIIIGTDGDFNVGPSSTEELVELIEEKRNSGIYITVIGVGRGNLNDHGLEQIANNGNGTYEYVDGIPQLKKVFIYDFNKFFTVAKDVKVQVTFNEVNVEFYRLIGYENRVLNNDDFEDDEEDAGEIGSGQNITAIYEIKPAVTTNLRSEPTFTFDFRYKEPDQEESKLIEVPVYDQSVSFTNASDQMKFVGAVAGFGMILRDSPYKGDVTVDKALEWLESAKLEDTYGFKHELHQVMLKFREM